MTFLAAAAAFMLSGSAAPVAGQPLPDETIGPFRLSSAKVHVDSHPYPYDHKTVTLAWSSSDGAARFSLVDTGEGLTADFEDRHGGTFRCNITSPPLTLNLPVRSYFRVLTDGGCSNVDAARKSAVRREIREVTPFMKAAFARFRAASTAFFGPSERRCVEYDRGHHGLICSRYRGKQK